MQRKCGKNGAKNKKNFTIFYKRRQNFFKFFLQRVKMQVPRTACIAQESSKTWGNDDIMVYNLYLFISRRTLKSGRPWMTGPAFFFSFHFAVQRRAQELLLHLPSSSLLRPTRLASSSLLLPLTPPLQVL